MGEILSLSDMLRTGYGALAAEKLMRDAAGELDSRAKEIAKKDKDIERLKNKCVEKENLISGQVDITLKEHKRAEKAKAELTREREQHAGLLASCQQVLVDGDYLEVILALSKIQGKPAKYRGCKSYKGPPWGDGETKYGGFCPKHPEIEGGDFPRLKLACFVCIEEGEADDGEE